MKLTTRNIKTLSKNINKKFQEMSCDVKHTNILNLISNSFGYKSYNALKKNLESNLNLELPRVHLCFGNCGSGKTTRLIKSYSLNSEFKNTFIFNDNDVRDIFKLTNKINLFNNSKKYDSIYIDDITDLYITLENFNIKLNKDILLNCKDIYIVIHGKNYENAIKRIGYLEIFDKKIFNLLFDKNNIEIF